MVRLSRWVFRPSRPTTRPVRVRACALRIDLLEDRLVPAGLTITQGDRAVRADDVRQLLGLDGSGVTIGVISDSYNLLNGASGDVASGDLPVGVNVLSEGGPGGRDEGRAMLQIIHDIAPGARLFFAAAGTTQVQLAASIRALANAGADIIVDDITFPAEPMFQDGIVAQAVDQVAAAGVVYFSAAGNLGRQSYQSAYVNSGMNLGTGLGGSGVITTSGTFLAHDFGGGDFYQTVTLPAGKTTFSFQWSDRYASAGGPGAQADMDLALFDMSGAFLSLIGGFTANTGADPTEVFEVDAGAGGQYQIALGKFSGPDPALVKYVAFSDGFRVDEYATDSSTVFGHANAAGGAAVGAARYSDTPRFGTDPAAARAFTGRGGTPILFDTGGNPQTPATRPEPRFVAPDGVNTTFFGTTDDEPDGRPNFTGTSAAAPHAAGVAALLLQANRNLTPTQVFTALSVTALDIGPAGFDADAGAGLIQALPAVVSVGGPFDVTLDGTAADDSFVVRRDPSGAKVEFVRNGEVVLALADSQLGHVTVRGGVGSDTLTLDYTHGEPLTSSGLSFAGGESLGDKDRLVLGNYTVTTVVVNHAGPETGTVQIGTTGLVSFAEIEPLVLAGTAADLLINLPTMPNPDVTVGDDGGPADPDGPAGVAGFSAVSGSTFEYTRFRNPTRGLLVTLGSGGDTVALRPLDAAFAPTGAAAVTIDGGTGGDAVTFFGSGGDDTIGYSPNAADGGTLAVTGGPVPLSYAFTGIENLTADGLGEAAADAVTVFAPRLAVAFGLAADTGTVAASSATGAVWLSLAYRNFERAGASGADVAVAGTGADDTVTLAADGTVVVGTGHRVKVTATRLDLAGLAGNDSFTLAADHPFAGGVLVNGNEPGGGGNSLAVVGSGGAVAITPGAAGFVNETGHGVIQYAGFGAVSVDAGAGLLTLTVGESHGTTGAFLTGGNTATVRLTDGMVLGVTAGGLFVLGPTNTFDDRLRVSSGVSGAADVNIVGGAVRFAGLLPVVAGAGIDAVDVIGGAGDDTFTVSPGAVPMFLDGGPHAAGDKLVVLGSVSGRPTPGAGTINTNPAITYQGVESFALGAVPSTTPDAVTATEGAPVSIPVLGNDGGLDDGPLVVTIITAPQFGTAAVIGTSVVYTPNPGYNSASGGPDTFRYRVEDANGDAAVGTATVTVAAVNAPPVAFAQSVALEAGGSVALTLLGEDSDPDVVQTLTYTILTAPMHGALTAFSAATGRLTYTPFPGYDGPDSFTFVVTDDATAGGPARTSSAAVVYLQTNRVNRPPTAAPDKATLTQGGVYTSPANGVRANDSDPDGDALAVSLVTGPAHGTLALDRHGSFTYTPDPAYSGSDSFVYGVADGRGGSATATVSITITPTPRRLIATGAGVGGGPHVKVFDAATGAELFSFFAYDPAFRGGVRVAVGDVNGDGVADIITTPGPGGGPHVRVFSGVDLAPLASFFAFDPSFRSGANVAVGDLDGDGINEVITAAAPGGGSHVRAFEITGGQGVQIGGAYGSFFAFAPDYTGGVNVAVGDYDGVAGDEIIVAAASQFPQVRVFGRDGTILTDFLAFDVAKVGITVAAGDVDGDGRADIIVGPGDGGGPLVRVFSGRTGELIGSATAFDADLRGGISVAATPSRTGDGRAAVVVAPTQQARSVVVLDTKDDTLLGLIDAYSADFPGGVFVGAG